MSKNSVKIIYGLIALILLVGIFYGSDKYAKNNVQENSTVEGKIESALPTGSSLGPSEIEYKNEDYGFSIILPSGWLGYSVLNGEWKGYRYVEGKGDMVVAQGPLLKIRHPEWKEASPRQDIPIMIFTPDQWAGVNKESFRIGAAPIGPSGLGKNSKYVFALPARYNYAYLTGWEEVEQIIKNKSIYFFN